MLNSKYKHHHCRWLYRIEDERRVCGGWDEKGDGMDGTGELASESCKVWSQVVWMRGCYRVDIITSFRRRWLTTAGEMKIQGKLNICKVEYRKGLKIFN